MSKFRRRKYQSVRRGSSSVRLKPNCKTDPPVRRSPSVRSPATGSASSYNAFKSGRQDASASSVGSSPFGFLRLLAEASALSGSAPVAASAPAPAFASDGFANPAALLGDDSPLLSSGTFRRSNLTANPELLTAMYRTNWICKRIIDMPTEDMTRAWYTLDTALPEEDLREIRALEARHSVKQELANAIRWARLYGGSLALMVLRGEEDRLDRPVDPDLLLPGCFQGLLVLDRTQGVSPSLELESDLDSPHFGLPKYYEVSLTLGARSGLLRIHHSRLLLFTGRELPREEAVRESYWGASEMEHLYDEILKRSATSANIAQLVFQANITTLKMSDFGEKLALGTENQKAAILRAMEEENRFRTSFGLQLLSQDDTWENHPYSFSGLSEIYEAFMLDMAGAAEIPATRLFGRSPAGQNATGESDLRNYYESIAQMQERTLRPALEKLLPILMISALGQVPENLRFHFDPLMTTSQESRAQILATLTTPVLEAFRLGLISRAEAVAELKAQGASLGAWTKLADPPPEFPGASSERGASSDSTS